MTLEQYEAGRTAGATNVGTKVWAGIVIVGMVVLALLSVIGNNSSSAAERNTKIVQQNTARTECIRGIAAELDHARWSLVGEAFNATSREQSHQIGVKLNGLPLLTELADRGGLILGERVGPCPPASTDR